MNEASDAFFKAIDKEHGISLGEYADIAAVAVMGVLLVWGMAL